LALVQGITRNYYIATTLNISAGIISLNCYIATNLGFSVGIDSRN